MTRRSTQKVAQAWIELFSDDPEAVSTLAVARAHLAAGRGLRRLRRMRLIEVAGRLPAREKVEEMLHRSTQFYNPHKERCTLRLGADEAAPVGTGELAVLVVERDGSRREAAERWWRHETGEEVEVREALAWTLSFEEPAGAGEAAEELLRLRDRRHGLLCNPHSQECRAAPGEVPVPWIGEAREASPAKRRRTPARSAR